MDSLNEIVLNYAGGDQIQKELPASLKPKIAFYKKAHRLPAMASFQEEGLAIAAEVGAQKESRHDFVHGVMESKANSVDGGRTLLRNIYEGARIRRKAVPYSHDQGWAVHEAALKLARRSTSHALAVSKALLPKGGDDLEG